MANFYPTSRIKRFEYEVSKVSTILPPEKVTIQRQVRIGKGVFSTVYGGHLISEVEECEANQVAIKIPNKNLDSIQGHHYHELINEIAVLSKLKHANIIVFFGVLKVEEGIALVFERVFGQDMETLLCSRPSSQLNLTKSKQLLIGIARGMTYLHTQIKVMHRDLKPSNVLVNVDFGMLIPKICDFGMVSDPPSDPPSDPNGAYKDPLEQIVYYGTPLYAAPELPDPDHSFKVDVFSFAVVMWQTWARRRPFRSFKGSLHDLRFCVTTGLREELDPECPWADLISLCWQLEPTKRPAFEDICLELEKCIICEVEPVREICFVPEPHFLSLLPKRDKVFEDDELNFNTCHSRR